MNKYAIYNNANVAVDISQRAFERTDTSFTRYRWCVYTNNAGLFAIELSYYEPYIDDSGEYVDKSEYAYVEKMSKQQPMAVWDAIDYGMWELFI